MPERKVFDVVSEANQAFEKRDWKTLINACEALLASGQNISHTYYLLGMANLSLGSYAIARHFFEQANQLKPLHPAVLNNLATCEYELNNREAAIKYYKKSIQQAVVKNDPSIGLYYSNLAGAYTGYGQPELGEKYIRLAMRFGTNQDHWSIQNNLSVVLLEQKKYKEGFEYYDYRLGNTDTFKPKFYCDTTLPQWQQEPDCTVVIYGEQGLGDEIMFASLIEAAVKDMEARNCKVIFDCNNRLLNIFRQSFPDMEIYGTKNYAHQEQRVWDKIVKPTHQIAIGSLAKYYWEHRRKDQYIKINDTIKIIGDRPKIGFSWYGGIAQTNIHHRYIALEKWKEIFKLPFDFISLQYNEDAGLELEEFKQKHGIENIYHNSNIMADFDKTAELINGLDLIISSPQTCVHLGAAMGKEVWQLTPIKAMWQMNCVEDMYNSCKIIRQSKPDEWEDVMERVKQDLKVKYANN